MGLFLAMSGIVGGSEDEVVAALRDYAEKKDGLLEEAKLTTEDDGCLIVCEGMGGITVLYPFEFFEWDDAAQNLSKQINKPVFSFHIHDGDLWMYTLYELGETVDQFNPVPDYWQQLDESDLQSWQGNAAELVKRVPGVARDDISKYLVRWDDEVFEADERKKAYPSDRFYFGDDWQLVDFMGKLGLDYPVDDSGTPQGNTYRFNCKQSDFDI